MRFGVFLLVCLGLCGPVLADQRLVQSMVISKPGEPIEVRGTLSRIVGYFDRQGDRLAVTVFISGNVRGQVLRGSASLADGQRYSLQREGAGGAETIDIRRRGDRVVLSVSSGLRVARDATPELRSVEQSALRSVSLD